MTDYTVNAGEEGIYEVTSVAGDADTVQFTDKDDYREADVKLFTDGAGSIFYRVDGEEAIVGDQEAKYIPGFPGEADILVPRNVDTISLVSDAAVTYSVYKG